MTYFLTTSESDRTELYIRWLSFFSDSN